MMMQRSGKGLIAGVALVGAAMVGLHIATSQPTPDPTALSARCDDLVARFMIMGSEITSLDQQLYGKVESMRRAGPQEQVAAVEAVIEELVAQRPMMREQLKTTHQMLVVHLVEHVMVEPAESAHEALEFCPIFKAMRPELRRYGSGGVPTGPLDR